MPFLLLLESQFPQIAVTSKLLFVVVAAAFTILVTSTFLTILVTSAAFTVLVTGTAFAVLMASTFLTILVTGAALAVLMTGTFLTFLVTGAALAILVAGTFLTFLVTGAALGTALMVTAAVTGFIGIVVAASMSGTATATSGTFFCTTASRQFGSCSRVCLHVVGVVTQLAHLLTQLVGIGLLGIVIDGQLRGLHVIVVRFNALEIRHVLFEFVRTLLTHAIGLDRHGLLPFGGRFALLRTHAQRNQAH